MSRKTRETILKLLARKEEVEQSKMTKETGLSYPTIIKHLKKLKESNTIYCVREEPSSKGGKEKKFWALTTKGFLNSQKSIPFDVFVKGLSKRKELSLLNRKVEQWSLTETPKLSQEIIEGNQYVLYDGSFNEEEVEKNIGLLLLGLIFWDDYSNEEISVYAQDVANITPDDPQMRKEAETFLKNNPWMKRKLSGKIDEYLKLMQHELDFITKIRIKWERRE